MNWISIQEKNQIDNIIELSKSKPQLIFKHSTRCSISAMAKNRLEFKGGLSDKIDAYYLDLIAFRELSNEIATRFNVFHESPQILLIKDGECILDASHNAISLNLIENSI